MVAAAVTTATIIPSTCVGGEPGGRPRTKTSTASPMAATVPRPMPPTRAPTKMAARTTRNSSQITRSFPPAAGHRFRIQVLPDLRLGQNLCLPHDLQDPLSGHHGLGGQLGRPFVADDGIQRGDDADAALEERLAGLTVGLDAVH